MNWYYAQGDERIGPLKSADVDAAVRAGKITPDTLVWHEGLADWAPYSSVSPTTASKMAVAEEATCAECGKTFAPDELIPIENSLVCGNCKPIAVQKLKEGVALAGGRRYAGFWIRFVAKIVDGVIVAVVNFAIGMFFGMAFPGMNEEAAGVASILLFMVQQLVGAAYVIWFLGRFGATPGKMAFGLKVIVADGSNVSYLRATGRSFAEFISAMILLIGYVMAAFDEEKRTLHDRICDTRVIYS